MGLKTENYTSEIIVTSPGGQWVNSLRPRPNRRHFADDIFKGIFENNNEWISPRISLKFVPRVRINNIPALVQIMAWGWPGDKPLSEPMVVSLLTHICVTRPQWVKSYDLVYLEYSWINNWVKVIFYFLEWRIQINSSQTRSGMAFGELELLIATSMHPDNIWLFHSLNLHSPNRRQITCR